MTARFAPAIIAALTLTACADRGDRANADNDIANEEGTGNTQSILREEVRAEMEPLVATEEEGPRRLVVGFPTGGTALDDDAIAALDAFADRSLIEGDYPILLTGHSDTVGSDAANFRAGEARAAVVADYLVDKGVDRDRISIITLGEGNPAQPNYLPDGSDNVEGQAANRRVEIVGGEDAGAAVAE